MGDLGHVDCGGRTKMARNFLERYPRYFL